MRKTLRSLPLIDRVLLLILAVGVLACFGPGPDSDSEPAPAPSPSPGSTDGASGCRYEAGAYRGDAFANGTVQTEVAPLQYENRPTEVSFGHKRDVDPVEDGCIGGVRVLIQAPCRLLLSFGTKAGSPDLHVQAAELVADSQCPGWLDAQEGNYELDETAPNTSRLGALPQVADNQGIACVVADLRPEGTIQLSALDRPTLTLDLSTLVIAGSGVSRGAENGSCPAP